MFIGVDLGGTKILAGIVPDNGAVLKSAKVKTRQDGSPNDVIDQIVILINSLFSSKEYSFSQIGAIGIGVPGTIDIDTGTVIFAPNLNWRNIPLKTQLENILEKTVVVANDVNAGTIGEHWIGAGIGKKNVAGLFIGTGVGGAIIVNNELYCGENGIAAEVGHMIVVLEGELCGCGNRGCLEAYAGKVSITRNLLANGVDLSGQKLVLSSFLAAGIKHDDKRIKSELKRVCDYLAIGIGNIAGMFDPDLVILGGGVIESCGDYMLPRINKRLGKNIFNKVKIVAAKLGDNAGIIGAAKLAMDYRRIAGQH